MLQIHFLGQPRFFVDGEPHKFSGSRKALTLLAYLLLNRGVPLARDSAAFTLWADDTEEDARADLRRHLNYVKTALPAAPQQQPWISAEGDTLQWNPVAPAWFDVAEFERSAAVPNERARAIELYAGDLLENLYDDWLFPARERLRNLFISCLNELLLDSRSRSDFAAAIALAQRILRVDPWREDTVRHLMSVRYEAGDRAGALRDYDDFKRRLRDEMDVDPMLETSALRETIVRNAPVADVQVPERSVAGDERVAAPSLPFVGRDAEMDELRALWNRAAHGRGGAVLISGEPGIGKSRLASELALLVGAQGGRVLVGGTLHPESAPYQPIAEALRSALPLVAGLDLQPIWLSAVGQIVPELRARRTDLPPLPALDPERERARLFEAMASCLQGFAKPRPVLLVLEDLQWAGEATIAALEFLARRAIAQSVLIVGTYRSGETDAAHSLREARRRLQREGLVGHLDLARLAESAVRDVFLRVPELRGASESAAAHAYAESEGNPLFLGEVIRDSVESGSAPRNAIPHGLRDTIQARVSRLSEQARFVAQLAAVVGPVFDIDAVAQISGWPESQTLDAIEELVDRHVVREAGRRAAFDYAFTHHLVQSAIYDAIPADGRARWHRRAARAMQSIHGDRGDEIAAMLATHFDRAGDAAEAATQYLGAARNAAAVYANDEALAHAARGLELSSNSDERYELTALQESLDGRLGRRTEQLSALDELERIARESDDIDRRCDVLARRVALHRAIGEREQELARLEEFSSRADSSGDPDWRARAQLSRATYYVSVGKLDDARRSLDSALLAPSKRTNKQIETECLCRLAYVLTLQGSSAEGIAAISRAIAAAEASGNQALLAQSLFTASTAAALRQDFAQTHHFAERALEAYRAIGDREGEADCCARLGMAAGRRLLIDLAREWYEKARTIYGALGKRQGQAAVSLNVGLMYYMVGLVDQALDANQAAARIFEELDDLLGITLSTLNMGIARYTQGEYEEAKRLSQRALELARSLGSARTEAAALGNLGAVERELGDLSSAIEHLHAALDVRKSTGTSPDGALDLAELAITYARTGDKAAARRTADELMSLDESSYEMTVSPQLVPSAAAQAYRVAGQRKRASEALERARAILARRLAKLPDDARTAYERLPYNRELLSK